jgi:WD40 repeat protein
MCNMSTQPRTSTNEGQAISSEIVIKLDADVVHICHDEKFLYAACRDQFVRVWLKENWKLEAELGETSTIPLSVQVDEEQVYATCDQKVYVWNKDSWGMIGWFDLSYQAITSTLFRDYFYIGSKDGRLVSIRKDTHETSSWQLHKSSVTSLWTDERIICTSTSKGSPRVWMYGKNQAPTELASFEKKDRSGVLFGNDDFILVGTSDGEIRVWDRVDWNVEHTFETKISDSVVNMWANNQYLIASFSQGSIVMWDFKRNKEIGRIHADVSKIYWLDIDHDIIYLATSDGILVMKLMLADRPFDITSGDEVLEEGLLRTSPYDVLEDVLEFQNEGDAYLEDASYLEAVAEYENALQILIDNSHALLEVPEEREQLAMELNKRLGIALLKAKILDLNSIVDEIKAVSDQLEEDSEIKSDQEEIGKLWDKATRAIKESRVLSEAQAGNMLSYQLSSLVDNLEEELKAAMDKFASYRAVVNTALALTYRIESEWKRMERRRTKLTHRRGFLERAMKELEDKLEEAENTSEVKKILSTALNQYKKTYEQISRILSASKVEEAEEFSNKEEALVAIKSLLKILPKKKSELSFIVEDEERQKEEDLLIAALEQALETAEKFKLKKESKLIFDELESITNES